MKGVKLSETLLGNLNKWEETELLGINKDQEIDLKSEKHQMLSVLSKIVPAAELFLWSG